MRQQVNDVAWASYFCPFLLGEGGRSGCEDFTLPPITQCPANARRPLT